MNKEEGEEETIRGDKIREKDYILLFWSVTPTMLSLWHLWRVKQPAKTLI